MTFEPLSREVAVKEMIAKAPNRTNVCQEQGWHILRGFSIGQPPDRG